LVFKKIIFLINNKILTKKHMKFMKLTGFTLIELIVVIVIIATLIGVSMPAASNARMKARDGRRVEELREIETALRLYSQSHSGNFPVSDSGETISASSTLITALVPYYLLTQPEDPKPESFAYYYKTAQNGTFFKLTAYMEKNKDLAQDDGGAANDFYEVYNYSGDKVSLERETLCAAMPAGCP